MIYQLSILACLTILQNIYLLYSIIACIANIKFIYFIKRGFVYNIVSMGILSILFGITTGIFNLILASLINMRFDNIRDLAFKSDLIYSTCHPFTILYMLSFVDSYIVKLTICIIFELFLENTYIILINQSNTHKSQIKQYTKSYLLASLLLSNTSKDKFVFISINNMIFVSESMYIFHHIIKLNYIDQIDEIILNPNKDNVNYMLAYLAMFMALSAIYVAISYLSYILINQIIIKIIQLMIKNRYEKNK